MEWRGKERTGKEGNGIKWNGKNENESSNIR